MISVKHFRNFEFDLQSAASESACIRSVREDKQTLTHLTIEIMFINENCFFPNKELLLEKSYIDN